ncbi:MAG: response regulator [Desmonostoc vinosum HA7617-LM4]|jgi:PAS domain S-box-containing protein|nr:response regulator [Desmonostoc vinosum HA7617-LM4]
MSVLRFLLLEDSVVDALLIQTTLMQEGIDCELLRVESDADFLAALQTETFDLILSDYILPAFDGISALEIAQNHCPDTPFIFVSAVLGEELAIEALKNGAIDYVLKQRLGRLAPSIQRALREAQERRDRKLAEAALERSEARFRSMAEKIQDVFWITDFNIPQILYVSPAYEQIWGRSRNELYQNYTTWLETIHPEDREKVKATALTCQHEDYVENEYRIVRPDGSIRWIRDRGFAIRNAAGEIYQVVGVAQDITERKHTEAERDRLLQLEQIARSDAETANRIKDEFLAVLSHELRSPLNPILGWAKFLQTHKLDETTLAKALATIERNAQLQAQLIEDLLDVSRILQGKINLEMASVNLITIIEAAIETVRLAAEAKNIQIETIFNADVGPVLGDSARLQQVLWNLLSNAVKFTPSGGRVNIQLECRDAQAQITVNDTGKGIKPDFLPYVFDYFRQADSTITRKFGGLGLGLAIVRHLVELHGGTVWAESPGESQGASFSLKLPLMKSGKISEDGINSTATAISDSSPLMGMTILVVDDDHDTREFLCFVLEQFGAIATSAASAFEALQLLEQSQPDILLSDIGMPEMDGYMLIQQIRALEAGEEGQGEKFYGDVIIPPFSNTEHRGQYLPAIALTAYAGEINQQQAIRAGFQKHLSKPIAPEQLLTAISELIGRR